MGNLSCSTTTQSVKLESKLRLELLAACPCFTKEFREKRLHPVFGRFTINTKGYPRLSRCSKRWPNRYLHIVVWETVAGVKVPEGFHVHHQDGDKWHCCPYNLVALPAELNPIADQLRCPYTGKYLTVEQWRRRLGELPERYRNKLEEVPF